MMVEGAAQKWGCLIYVNVHRELTLKDGLNGNLLNDFEVFSEKTRSK